jgi:hypothetical protein
MKRTHRNRILQATGLLLVLGLIVAAVGDRNLRVQANVGAGYVAHQICSCVHVANRSLESCLPDMLPVMDRIRSELVDVDGHHGVRAWIPVFSDRTAIHTPGLGCALD